MATTTPPSHGHERVLVVSIDGLAPRAVSRATTPNLSGLAARGGSCFTALTVEPPITVPAHASMFHGVPPSVHESIDNTRRRPSGGQASFLAAARAAGRRTASAICWLPLDELIEPDAVDDRIVVDGGYDPGDDDRMVAAAARQIADTRNDVVLTYLVACDLAGHESGWDSEGYAAAVARTDVLLGELVRAAGDDVAILVTTDHGGQGRSHGEPVADTMATFVVVRSARVRPASMWRTASILDVAPTVADLLRVPPDPAWHGESLLGSERPIADHLLALVASMAAHAYGERVDMLSHALQSAATARRDGAGDGLVLAALLHDIGHVLGEAGAWGVPDHAELGARALQAWLPAEVVEPIRLHVAAKRYLVATDPAYGTVLSDASVSTLAQQGGPFTQAEAAAFEARPFADDAVRLRRWDDAGKVEGIAVPEVDDLRPALMAALADDPAGSPVSGW